MLIVNELGCEVRPEVALEAVYGGKMMLISDKSQLKGDIEQISFRFRLKLTI